MPADLQGPGDAECAYTRFCKFQFYLAPAMAGSQASKHVPMPPVMPDRAHLPSPPHSPCLVHGIALRLLTATVAPHALLGATSETVRRVILLVVLTSGHPSSARSR